MDKVAGVGVPKHGVLTVLSSTESTTYRPKSAPSLHPARARRAVLTLVLSSFMLCSTMGCETKQDLPPTQRIDSLEDKQARRDADALRKNLPALLDALARSNGRGVTTLASTLEVSAQSELPASSHPNLPGLRTLYAANAMELRWFEKEAPYDLSPEGLSWVSALKEVERTHGIFDEEFELATIQQALATLNEPRPSLEVDLDEAQQEALTSWFETHASAYEADADNARLLEALLAEQGPLAVFEPSIAALSEHYARQYKALHEADLLLSSALMTYARRMRFQNKAWQRDAKARHKEEDTQNADAQIGSSSEEDSAQAAKKETPPTLSPEKLAEAAIKPFFTRADDAAPSLPALLESLQPPFEQYGRLTKAYQRYQDIVAQGGWQELPESVVGLKPGSSGPAVTLLKQRLRAEKMWDGDDSETYDKALAEAVKHYQHTHQIWEKGFITKETWRSMNIPAYRRMLRIRYSLERWRNLRIGPDEDYIYVNIPDFHAELWSGQERELRFRVVTGSARKEWNPKTRKHERPQATKLFSDTMEYVVFNPYWNVPKGIVESEISPKLEENPDYLEENFYEWHDLPSGNRIMRQTPGVHNALGLVKFLFPNDHNIYLHDTNQKGYFDYPIRAFSHGCIRVQEPMKLAEFLLKRDGQWSSDLIARHTKPGGGESWITLKKPLPVHIEYVVVRVDDEGHAHFLADIYNLEAKPMTDISAKDRAYGVASLARSLSSAKQDKIALNP